MWASIRLRVKWNIGRISIFDFAMRNARSTCQRLCGELDGKGCLKMDDGTIFKPNDRYRLTRDTFRFYYTSLSTDRQTIEIYVEDNFG